MYVHLDHVWSAAHPENENAPGGMYAFSEAIYHVFQVCLLMVPTGRLIWLMSKFRAVYAAYSKVLFVLNLTLPVLLAVSSPCSDIHYYTVNPAWD